jgi:hypothetical protein
MSALPENSMGRPEERDSHREKFRQWFALLVLLACWVVEASI